MKGIELGYIKPKIPNTNAERLALYHGNTFTISVEAIFGR
jgi:hypothetical protein